MNGVWHAFNSTGGPGLYTCCVKRRRVLLDRCMLAGSPAEPTLAGEGASSVTGLPPPLRCAAGWCGAGREPQSPSRCPLSSLVCGLQCRLCEGLTAPAAVVVGFSGEWDLAALTPPSKQVFPRLCPCCVGATGVSPQFTLDLSLLVPVLGPRALVLCTCGASEAMSPRSHLLFFLFPPPASCVTRPSSKREFEVWPCG